MKRHVYAAELLDILVIAHPVRSKKSLADPLLVLFDSRVSLYLEGNYVVGSLLFRYMTVQHKRRSAVAAEGSHSAVGAYYLRAALTAHQLVRLVKTFAFQVVVVIISSDDAAAVLASDVLSCGIESNLSAAVRTSHHSHLYYLLN